MRNFTPDDLIAFHYNESSITDTAAVANALAASWPLQEKYQVIHAAAAALDSGLKSPRKQSVARILDYAVAATDTAIIE